MTYSFGLQILVRPPAFMNRDGAMKVDPALVARLSREIRELAEERLGHEIVVDILEPR